MRMTKTAALKEAQKNVGRPIGGGTSWCFYAPYWVSEPSGRRSEVCTTEVRADSYWKAANRRAKRVAELALSMMGVREKFGVDPVDWVEYTYGPMSAKKFVDEVLKLNPKQFKIEPDYSWCE